VAADAELGFVGLGGMGGGLVKNLRKHGRAVRVLDRRPEAVQRAVDQGASAASGIKEIAERCDTILFCVNTAEDVEALILGPRGLLSFRQRGGLLVVDHTTTNPETVLKLAAAVERQGGRFAEAPMTRTPKHADAGQVNVFYGGSEELLREIAPIFKCYAENIFHIGPHTHATKLKLIHNYIAFANVAAWCEGFALAAKEGLDLSRAIEIISAAGAKSGMLDLYGRATLERDFTPWMSLANARKDVQYYARWLEQAGLPGFMAEAVHQTYRQAAILGHDAEGCTAVIKAYEEVTGVEAKLPTVPNPPQR
jgi:2-hydroxy-3-oxopropionate reductase